MKADLDGLLQRFVAWGARPTVDAYLELFTEDATLFDSGMAVPLPKAGIRPLMTQTLRMLEGFSFRPVRHGRNEETLFVEAANAATIAGVSVSWDAVYCMTAAGDQVRRGRRYYDQAAVFAPLVGSYEPERPHPQAGPISLTPVEVGSGDDAWFREWSGTVAPQGIPLPFDAVERYADGASRWFANSLVLRPAALAQVLSVRAAITG